MKIRFEATETTHHEGVADLLEEEAAEYRALASDDERTEWLRTMVQDLVNAGDHEDDSELEDGWFAYVDEDDEVPA